MAGFLDRIIGAERPMAEKSLRTRQPRAAGATGERSPSDKYTQIRAARVSGDDRGGSDYATRPPEDQARIATGLVQDRGAPLTAENVQAAHEYLMGGRLNFTQGSAVDAVSETIDAGDAGGGGGVGADKPMRPRPRPEQAAVTTDATDAPVDPLAQAQMAALLAKYAASRGRNALKPPTAPGVDVPDAQLQIEGPPERLALPAAPPESAPIDMNDPQPTFKTTRDPNARVNLGDDGAYLQPNPDGTITTFNPDPELGEQTLKPGDAMYDTAMEIIREQIARGGGLPDLPPGRINIGNAPRVTPF